MTIVVMSDGITTSINMALKMDMTLRQLFSLTHNYLTVRIQGLEYRLSIIILEFRFKTNEYMDI